MTSISERIQNDIDSQEIVLFMKGNALFPQCGFSSLVVKVLEHLKVTFKDIDVLQDMELREGIKQFSDWPTIPQLYVNGEFVGGCDIIKDMYESGELMDLLKEKDIAFTDPRG